MRRENKNRNGVGIPRYVLRFKPGDSNVIHFLLQVADPPDVFHELLQRHVVEHLVGGFGELIVEEMDRDLARRSLVAAADLRGAGGKPAFETADEIADADFARLAREPVPPAAADLALQKSAATKGEQNRFEELVG
jgi:hypothetical protein